MPKFHQAFLSVTLLSLSCANNLFASQLNCQHGDLRQRQVITGLTASDSISSEKRADAIAAKKTQRSCGGNLFVKCCLQATCRGLSRAYGWCKEKAWSAPKSSDDSRERDEKAKKEQEPSLVAQIGLENQKSFRGRLGVNQVRSSQDDPYAYYKYKRTMIYTPTDRGNAERSFSLLACAETQWKKDDKRPDWFDESVVDRTALVDLNLFSGSLDKPDLYAGSLLGEFVVSGMGKAYLCGLLGRPTDKKDLLEARQKIVRILPGNLSEQAERKECSQNFEVLRAELKVFAEHEKFLTEFLDERYPRFVADLIDYYQTPFSSYLNRSVTALEIKALKSYAATVAHQILLTSSAVVLPVYGLWELSSFCSSTTPPEMLENHASIAAVTAGGPEFLWLAYTRNHLLRSTLGVVGLLSAVESKRHWSMSHANLLDHDLMRKVLMHAAQVIRSMKRIHTIVKRLPEDVRRNLTFFDRFDKEFINSEDKDIQQLLSLFDSETFTLESDDVIRYAYSYGRVLCAWKLLRDCRDKFALPLAAIGEIDAYAGLAQLMRRDSGFHFAQYITDSKTPIIEAKNFCNLFVNRVAVVTNDICLGKRPNALNMILTGPNSAGKSMTVFGLVQQVVMAQSVGITLGEVSLTPFSNIETYRNISDSQVDQESRFQVEARRTDASLRKIDELAKQGKFKFTVFDELFSGTNPKSASDLTYEYAKILGTKRNSLCIISTHFLAVTELGKSGSENNFVNYGVPVTIHQNSSLGRAEAIRHYKLQEGVCAQDITRIVLAEIAEKENTKTSSTVLSAHASTSAASAGLMGSSQSKAEASQFVSISSSAVLASKDAQSVENASHDTHSSSSSAALTSQPVSRC